MKHVQSFESFNEGLINESILGTIASWFLPNDIKDKLKTLTKEQALKASEKIAKFLDIKVEDLGNYKKVVKALESKIGEDYEPAKQSVKESAKFDKGVISKFLQKAGLTSLAGGVLTMALSAEDKFYRASEITSIPDSVQIGMVAALIGFIAYIAGSKMSKDLENISIGK